MLLLHLAVFHLFLGASSCPVPIDQPTTFVAPEVSFPLNGTVWRYEDEELSYTISFDSEGKLITTHPFDTTPANDNWKQESGKIIFSYNNHFSVYEGTLVNEGLIVGTAKNGQSSWQWRAYRIDVL